MAKLIDCGNPIVISITEYDVIIEIGIASSRYFSNGSHAADIEKVTCASVHPVDDHITLSSFVIFIPGYLNNCFSTHHCTSNTYNYIGYRIRCSGVLNLGYGDALFVFFACDSRKIKNIFWIICNPNASSFRADSRLQIVILGLAIASRKISSKNLDSKGNLITLATGVGTTDYSSPYHLIGFCCVQTGNARIFCQIITTPAGIYFGINN